MILSFYDVTGEMVLPWAEQGLECICFDIQHDWPSRVETFPSGGSIEYRHADLYEAGIWSTLLDEFGGKSIDMVFGFPVCTDLAVSGAKHWAKKRAVNPHFQHVAVGRAMDVALFALNVGAPYMVENPVGAMGTIWRKADFYFHPCDYGGYIPDSQADHPRYPDYIAPRDAYRKKTGIWSGNGFRTPRKNPVEHMPLDKFGMSRQFSKLGGKSAKTKNIRSATPRGFARAVWLEHKETL
jgi:hypothetical protein